MQFFPRLRSLDTDRTTRLGEYDFNSTLNKTTAVKSITMSEFGSHASFPQAKEA